MGQTYFTVPENHMLTVNILRLAIPTSAKRGQKEGNPAFTPTRPNLGTASLDLILGTKLGKPKGENGTRDVRLPRRS